MTEVRTTSSTGGQKGVKNQRFDLIPVAPLTELAEHYGRGAQKYAPHQWRQGYEWSKSYAAIQRHLTAFWGGEDYDVCPSTGEGCSSVTAAGEPFVMDVPDTCYNHTGSHHMVAVAWHSFVLLEFKDTHPQHDDRYKQPTEIEQRSKRVQARLKDESLCKSFNNQLLIDCTRLAGHTTADSPSERFHGNGNRYWVDDVKSVCGHVLKSDKINYEMMCNRDINHKNNPVLHKHELHGYAGCFWDDEGRPM